MKNIIIALFLAAIVGAGTAHADQAQPPAPAPAKTWTDVGSHALDLVTGMVSSLAKTVQDVAPGFWRIMVRQQRAKAVADLIVPWAIFGAVLFAKYYARKRWATPTASRETSEWVMHNMFTVLLPGILFFSFACWGLNELSDSAKLLINPYYYAARDIVAMLLAPGAGL